MSESFKEARARIDALKATRDAAHGAHHGPGVYQEMVAGEPLHASASATGDFAQPLAEMQIKSASVGDEADITAAVQAAIAEANLEG